MDTNGLYLPDGPDLESGNLSIDTTLASGSYHLAGDTSSTPYHFIGNTTPMSPNTRMGGLQITLPK